ncbi:hypothetical protein [Streptomyces sp. NPDC002328]|uniref:hypothetical protein n=1 Tax=Streptomyces sp. NPDC002328 TaxID=3364642 RepID=UPI0036BAF7D7
MKNLDLDDDLPQRVRGGQALRTAQRGGDEGLFGVELGEQALHQRLTRVGEAEQDPAAVRGMLDAPDEPPGLQGARHTEAKRFI